MKTWTVLPAIVVGVQQNRNVGARSPKQRALREFVEAVFAFSDDPGPRNLERYLTASRQLEESRSRPAARRARRRRAAVR